MFRQSSSIFVFLSKCVDDYIVQKGIERPKLAEKYGGESMSKFARIKYQDEDDDDDDDVMDAGNSYFIFIFSISIID